ncbi:MAG TPA: signal peptidase I [Candidatus Saccharimonadales bacterium]|nr:signal peptidase I [Candidatus Saccharimonadales bacterium]
MFASKYSANSPSLILLGAMVVLSGLVTFFRIGHTVPPTTLLYVVQPVMALGLSFLAWYLSYDIKDRVRGRSDKAFVVGSVLAVWFVLYFLSGLATTYIHNSLFAGARSVIINLWAFGVVALAIEYSRHRILLIVGRRNAVWFGVIVALVLAVQQANFGLVHETHGVAAFIKLGFSDMVPAVVASFLATYLAIAGGLPTLLVYRLGLVACLILPPILPKYDWYLQGISLMLLAFGIYVALDRARQDRQEVVSSRPRSRPQLALDIMSMLSLVVLAMFMTGFFTYRPAAIASNSMKPVFSRGSMVIVQKIRSPMDVKVGDIVQYTRQDKEITHRVIAIDAAADGSGKRVFTTKGDNNPSDDPLVASQQIIGIVRSRIPFVGYPTVWLTGLARK